MAICLANLEGPNLILLKKLKHVCLFLSCVDFPTFLLLPHVRPMAEWGPLLLSFSEERLAPLDLQVVQRSGRSSCDRSAAEQGRQTVALRESSLERELARHDWVMGEGDQRPQHRATQRETRETRGLLAVSVLICLMSLCFS